MYLKIKEKGRYKKKKRIILYIIGPSVIIPVFIHEEYADISFQCIQSEAYISLHNVGLNLKMDKNI